MNKEDVCILPGTIQSAQNYGYDGLDIWMSGKTEKLPNAKIFIGHSLGVNFILESNANHDSTFIFINPPLKERCFFFHFINWLKFLVFEEFSTKKAVPAKRW